jgi:mycothiol system anti-sigma-R factor
MTCRTTARALDAFVDGELEASDSLHVEGHLDGCPTCAERAAFARAMKREIRREAHSERAPDALRARILRGAAGVRVREQERARRPSWRSAIPWAVAASIALMVGGGMRAFGTHPQSTTVDNHDPVSAAAAHSFILDEFGAYHASPLPPEEMDPVRISSIFSPIVGVPVHPAVFGSEMNEKPTRFSGARLMRVHDQAAATLFYEVGGRRVTIFVFDPQRIRLRGNMLSPRYVRAHGEDRVIFMGRAKGYPLAAFERDGVGYAVSSDMTDHDVLTIAASL